MLIERQTFQNEKVLGKPGRSWMNDVEIIGGKSVFFFAGEK